MIRQYTPRSVQRVPIAIALLVSLFAFAACINDLTPQGKWSSPVSDGNYIYVGNDDGVLVRLDAVSHAFDVNWLYPYELDGVRKKPEGLGAIYGAPVVEDGTVYAAGYNCAGSECNGEVFGISAESGGIAWNSGGYRLRTKLVGRLVTSDKGLLIFGTSAIDDDREPPGYLYALSLAPDAGRRVEWRVALDGEVWGEATIDDASNTAYVGTDAGTLYAIDTSSTSAYEGNPQSRIKWTFAAEGAIMGPVLFYEGSVYFGDLSGRYYRLNPNTQQSEWQFDSGAWIWAKGTPDDESGMIFISTLGGHIHGINVSTGVPVWTQRIEGQVVGTPLLFERQRSDFTQRVLAVPSGEDSVHVISVLDGQVLGTFDTDSAVKSSPVLINDLIYVQTLEGELKWFSPNDQTLQGCVNLKDGGRCE